jgi:sulfonate transport system substrate-binding protein
VATILSAQTGLSPEVVALAEQRYSYGVRPVTPEVLKAQQDIADAFHKLKLIPKAIVVRDAQPPAALQTRLLAKE